ncbi:DEAD/DEAH box helicase [Actinoplanes rectilineatus]|uniref:DEAD/DEAH box helicase n=1 Tax=Actinoplanes rectilineatus TaxID=113571 RepID=UPI000695BC68|nr:DEAD/DEAH box helicase [Actinoplanes rectilineatus]
MTDKVLTDRVLTDAEAAVCDVVGARAFQAARAAVAAGEILDARWIVAGRRASGRIRNTVRGGARANVMIGPDGAVTAVDGHCPCFRAPLCDHPLALVLAAGLDAVVKRAARPWEPALAALFGDEDPTTDTLGVAEAPAGAEIGLQFEVDADPARILLRPVVPGRTGWIRTGVTWQNLAYPFHGGAPETRRHVALLQELRILARGNDPYYYAEPRVIGLDDFASRRVWDLLLEAQEAGLPLVAAGRGAEPVVVRPEPVRFSVRADRDGDDLRLRPVLTDGSSVIDPGRLLLVGDPAHGVAWWDRSPRGLPQALRLAPLARPVRPEAASALLAPPIVVPVAEEQRFLRQYYPGLTRRAEVVAMHDSVRLPDLDRATLTLTGRPLPGRRLALSWEWVTEIGGEDHREPLGAGPEQGWRAGTLRAAAAILPPDGPTVVDGDVMIRLLRDLVPQLAALPGVAVDMPGDLVEEPAAPVVAFTSVESGERDWFDLAVQVSINTEQVDFRGLFVALAAEQEFLILPSGRYVTLDRPEFRRLRDLITESRELHDAPADTVRVGRHQAGVWQDLGELGEVTGPAADWHSAVRSLYAEGDTPRPPVPATLKATLRGYQEEGFHWLAALHRHGLGGVLADDMGLGKTVQTLALICHVLQEGGTPDPFLVVAPASVVGNWAAEAARFAPGLDVRVVQQTRARRPGGLAAAIDGADLVITSYTLFRLEFDDYAAQPWAGLILDEAQFVKNAGSQGYQCARRLPAAFKLAITGTPMENNLSELWALLSITAPGLLPRHDRFADYYRRPIERGQDQERLAQLRRRIRPLMLRRRKTEVAADLPAKQEQTIELELNPRHRRIYQTYLQRERQKVLGLLGDMQKNRFEIFRSLTLLRQASLDAGLVDPEHRGVASTKLDALVERVTDIVAEGHRILVFSQFTRFLGAARDRLADAGIDCSYLDGKTRDRSEVIAGFKAGDAPVFLVSLKSGGFGLNLTEADYCIMLDPWWNPATEAQAIDRIHRIGQTRNVMVYRLVAKDTIEEKVMALQARKAALSGSVLDGGDFGSAELTAADIQGLLE